MNKFKYLKKTKISQLPRESGVYTFKKGEKFLYIGKANSIRERVKNHLEQPAYRDGLFVNKVRKIGFIKTNSEIEALILEANLIKKYQPKYNVIWRDDKNYFFVTKTEEDFPRIFWTHQPAKIFTKQKLKRVSPESIYVGPFVDGKALKQALKTLRKVFPFRSCKSLPKRPCLWYQLNRCPAPCLLKSKLGAQIPSAFPRMKKECKLNAKNLIKIIQGKKTQVSKSLKREMLVASSLNDFEKAAKFRDQITALERVLSHAHIFESQLLPKVSWLRIQKILQKISKTRKKISRIEAYDISNIQGQLATSVMATFINGQPDKNYYRKFKIKIAGKPNDIAMLKECLSRRFRHPEWGLPDLILVDGGKAQLNVVVNSKLSVSNFQKIKVMALAKKENKLFIENQKKPILLKTLPREIFNLILQLRDEAHRFARKYHHQLREIDLRKKYW